MKTRWLISILSLPVPVLLLIPACLLFIFRGSRWSHSIPSPSDLPCLAGTAVGILGFTLAVWSASIFRRFAEGTPAPWDPPTRFIARGPYRYVRNPMIMGVMSILLAEGLILKSFPLICWFALFTAGNILYIPFFEERGLERRFGEPYLRYKRHVPRWLPWPRPWFPTEGNKE